MIKDAPRRNSWGVFRLEVKISAISFACDIEGDSSLLYVGGTDYGSERSCGKI